VDIDLFRLGWHNDPPDLRARLQSSIDSASGKGYDAVVMAYGLCGQSTEGLIAGDVPLVIPRAHDCITLFLGSRERYKDQFENHSGTYWYALDYVERKDDPGTSLSVGTDVDTDMRSVYDEYVAKYGQDNADYLMEVMGAWQAHYNRAAYIDMNVGDGADVEAQTRAEAARRGWTFERLAGDMVLIRRLLAGDWENDFLILEPGQHVVMSYDDRVIACAQRQSDAVSIN
jgi:hypothetical protein